MEKKIIVIIITVMLIFSSCSFQKEEPAYTPSPTLSPTVSPPPTAALTHAATLTPEPVPLVLYGYVALSNSSSHLNMRDQPSTSGNIIKSLPNGAQVEILEEDELWYKISYRDTVGYASSEFIGNLETLPMVAAAQANSSDIEQTVWINVDALRIREDTGTDSAILGQIPYGVSVEGIVDGNWMYISYNSMTGYIYLGEAGSGRACVVYNSEDLVALTDP